MCSDAADITSYTIAPVEGTRDRLDNPTRPVAIVHTESVDEFTVDLILDRPMSSYFASRYMLGVSGLVSAVGDIPFEDQEFTILGQFKAVPRLLPERAVNNRDIANPQTLSAIYDPLPIDGQPTDSILGRYQADSLGDVALDEGIVSYKKRVFRRLTTKKGSFAHLPDYGVLYLDQVKKLNLPGVRDSMASDAEDQIREEPETQSVSVRIRIDPASPEITFFEIRAMTRAGANVSLSVPVKSSAT